MKIEHNISRLKYLLELYKLSVDGLLGLISKGLSKPISRDDVFGNEIKLSHLKRIDSIFEKGLHYYLDPKAPEKSKEASIFFRKQSFGAELNIGARKIVNHFEEFKISLSGIAKLADINFERKVDEYTIKNPPKKVAQVVRETLCPKYTNDKREFLKTFIAKLAAANILVFEFVETWNKKEKSNIDGFFLKPNVIVIKRNQMAMRREIFTLAHELGHYLLQEEEIEEFDYQYMLNDRLSTVERWCNEFAFHFLAGDFAQAVDTLEPANTRNDYHHEFIADVSKHTHLSVLALYTRLLFLNKITRSNYSKIKKDIDEGIKSRIAEEKHQRELEKLAGNKTGGSTPKPINSPLLISTIQTAFHEGVIDEFEVCKSLNIRPENLEEYIQ